MNKLNELIALELGWEFLRPAMANVGRGQSTGIPPGELRTYVPNWAGDLNLMHELEASLKESNLFMVYAVKLDRIVGESLGRLDVSVPGLDCNVVHATAEQKAIAWLKVKGVEV